MARTARSRSSVSRAAAAPPRSCSRRDGRARSTRRTPATVAPSSTRRPARFATLGVDVELGGHDLDAHRASGARRRESRRAADGAAARRRARGRACRSSSEIEVALRFLPALTLHRDHRHERQDDDDGAHRPSARGARPSTRWPPATSARRSPSSRCATTPPDWIALEVSSFQLHDTPSIAPARRRAHEPLGESSRSVRERRRVLRRQGAAVPQRDGRVALGDATRDDRRRAGDGARTSPGTHCRFSRARRTPTPTTIARRGHARRARARRCVDRDDLAAARRSQRGERAGGVARGDARRPTRIARRRAAQRIADGAAPLPRARASHRDRRRVSTASTGSTIPSRPTSRRPSSRCAG